MSRFYDIDEANATLAELGPILSTLVEQRDRARPTARSRPGQQRERRRARRWTGVADDLRFTRLRILGLIDQMAAGVARIDELGIALRDIPTGLVDFPALVNGRQVWLCWRRGRGCDPLLARPRRRRRPADDRSSN